MSPEGGCSSATGYTDDAGHYTAHIPVTGATGTPATASKLGYASQTKSIAVVAGSKDFQLLYDLTASVSPGAVQPGQDVAISASTFAPASGFVCGWGRDSEGELGDGALENTSTPVAVRGPNDRLSLSGVASLAAADLGALALLKGGQVVGWGSNAWGQLGNGVDYAPSRPVATKGLGGTGLLTDAIAIATTGDRSFAVRADSSVLAWGYNGDGNLGDGTATDRWTPVAVAGIDGVGSLSGVTAVAAGQEHVLALRSDGTVVAWGSNDYGQLGDGSTDGASTPIVVSGVGGSGALTNVVGIAAAGMHSLALRADGTVVQWGLEGPTGPEDWWWVFPGYEGTNVVRTTPTVVPGIGGVGTLTGIAEVAANGYHNLARRGDGTVLGWGFNYDGELGNGTTADSGTPVAVHGLGGAGSLGQIVSLSGASSYSNAVVRFDGTVVSWGYNAQGQLGDASTASRTEPVRVTGVGGVGLLNGVSSVASGGLNTFATSSKPCASSYAVTKTIAQLPDGARLDLSELSTDADGYEAWSGSYHVPAGTPDGINTIKICVVASSFDGNCDAASTLASPPVTKSFAVDGTPPTLTSPSLLPNHNTTNRRPTLAIVASDGGSGVNVSTERIVLDGVTVASGTLSYTPPAQLATGVHNVLASVADNAGNIATFGWNFAVVTATVGSGTESLNVAVPVITIPAATAKNPRTDHVTFPHVYVRASAIQVGLSASATGGQGTIVTHLPLTGANVHFDKAGVGSDVVPTLPPRDTPTSFAVLSATPDPVTMNLPTTVVDVGPITVTVPTPYDVAGGTARFTLATGAMSGAIAGDDPLPTALPCNTAASCEVTGTVACQIGSGSAAQACGGTYPQVFLKVGTQSLVVGGSQNVSFANDIDTTAGVPIYDPVAPGNFFAGHPTCAAGNTCTNLLTELGASGDADQKAIWSAGSLLFNAFGHSRFYRTTGSGVPGPRIAAWMEGNAHPGAAPCVVGSASNALSRLSRFANSLEPTAGSWNLTGRLAATTGSNLQSTHAEDVVLTGTVGAGGDFPYAVGNPANLTQVVDVLGAVQGTFSTSTGHAYSANGIVASVVNGALNDWVPNASKAGATDHQLMTGVEYSGSNAASYGFQSLIFFDFIYDNSAC